MAEKNLNLSERMLVTPSIMALLRNKGQLRGSKMIHHEYKQESSHKNSKDFGHQKGAKSLGENSELPPSEQLALTPKNKEDEPHWDTTVTE